MGRLLSDARRIMATASLSLGPFLTKGIVDTWANTTTSELSTYSDYAATPTEATLATTEATLATTEATPAIGFIKALLIVVAFDDPTQAAIVHSGEATDKLIIMMLISTVLFALALIGMFFYWQYTTFCKSDKDKVSLPGLLDQMDTELRLLKEELRQHRMQQNGSASNGYDPDPRPKYTDLDLTNGGFQH